MAHETGTFTMERSTVEFAGQVWFRFGSSPVWTLYRFARAVAEAGIPVALDWQPLRADDEAPLMRAYLGIDDPEERGRFLHAALGLIHLEGRDAADPQMAVDAGTAAGLSDVGSGPEASLRDVAALADSLGVVDVPSLYRHGPPMRIVLTPAALMADPRDTLQAILAVSADDGIWELKKP